MKRVCSMHDGWKVYCESYISVCTLESILTSNHQVMSLCHCRMLVVMVSVGVVPLVCCICVLHMRVGRYAARGLPTTLWCVGLCISSVGIGPYQSLTVDLSLSHCFMIFVLSLPHPISQYFLLLIY